MNNRCHSFRLLAPLVILALLSSGAGSVALAAQTANGVATFHGDAARTGEQPGPAPEGAPALAWQFETGGTVRSSPVIADGVLYIGSSDGLLYALDAVNGTEQWRFETGGRITGAAAVADGSVFVGSADGYVYAIDAASGEQLWRFLAAELNANVSRLQSRDREGGSITSSIAVFDGLVFVTSNSFKVTAIDAETGIERWHAVAGGSDVTTPTTANGTLYVASGLGIDEFDAATGTNLWRAPFISEEDQASQPPASDPSAEDQNQSGEAEPTEEGEEEGEAEATQESPVTGQTSVSFPVDPLEGSEVSLAQAIETYFPEMVTWDISAAPVAIDDQLFVVIFGTTASTLPGEGDTEDQGERTMTTDLLALSSETGNITGIQYFYGWKPIVATPAIVDGTAFVGGDQGLLYAFDVEEGGERWGVQTEASISSSPAVADETVFFGNDDGIVFALATETGVEQWRFATGGPVRSSPVVLDGLVYIGSDDGSVYAIGGS